MKDRRAFIAELLMMPDEAFDWLVLSCIPFDRSSPNPGAKIWPDGLGGFMKESQESILKAQTLARQYAAESHR